jgi:hypothetical protein
MTLPFIEAAKVVTGQRYSCGFVNGLHRFPFNGEKRGPECFMPLRNYIDGAFKQAGIQRTLDAEADGHVKSGIAGA